MPIIRFSLSLLLIVLLCAGVLATGPATAFGPDNPALLSSAGNNTVSQSVPGTSLNGSPAGEAVLEGASLNPAFIRYQTTLNQAQDAGTELEHGLGDIPSPVSYPELTDLQTGDLSVKGFNSTFDLRDEGKVSAVRDQNGWGTCWAFATYGSLESNLLPQVNRTFSPKNLVNLHGFDSGYDDGGGIYMSTAYLTRWNGPVDEETDPYPVKNWTGSVAYPPVSHVQDVIVYPPRSNRTDTQNIKAGLERWGAAYVSIFWSNEFYNKSSAGYYMPETSPDTVFGGGHGVTLVGWNDTFPASAFNTTPPGDGAWIVKNSWGSAWGDDGFFYVSYYDKYLGSVVDSQGDYRSTAFFTGEPVDTFDQIYLHDPLGECRDYYIAKPGTGTVATRFNATAPGIISAIGFFTNDVNTRYTAVIYRNAVDGPLGEEAARIEGNLTQMGYHTVKLPPGSEVTVNEGEYFSVVLTLENAVYKYPVAFEEPVDGYSSRATANPGESYVAVSEKGPFYDLTLFDPNTSACLRAYTKTVPVPTPTPGILSASFTAKPVSGPSPLTVQLTDMSSGSPDHWIWSFGDGTQSLEQNPVKTYTTPGSYAVTLVIQKGERTDRVSKRDFITVRDT